MDKSKLRRFLFMKDKQQGITPPTKIGVPSIPEPKASKSIPSLPALPKMPKFGKTKNYFKK